MEELLTTDYASQVVSKVNTNFGGEVITEDDSAAEVVAALNTAFAGTSGAESLSAEDYAEDFIADVNTNFELYEQGGDEPEPVDATFKFLHISDPHGSASAAQVCKERMTADEDTAFLFVTGDLTSYGGNNGISSSLKTQLDAIPSGKLLMLAGNHDTYDNRFGTSGVSQQATTNFIKGYLGNNVTYGDTSGVASYWYKDFPIGEHTLRIISLDQYEIGKVRKPSANYFTMYSQAQVDWLIALMKELTADDYLIIATHEPPVQSPCNVPSGQSTDTYPDDYAVGLRPANNADSAKLFVTEGLRAFGNRRTEPNLNLLPRIMDAYLNKRTLTMTYNNYGGGSTPDISINEDFSQKDPATFLFYLGGHRHADIGTYLPDETGASEGGDWSKQLMLYMTCADRSTSYQYDDDLGGSQSAVTPAPTNALTYRINEVELDFMERTIKVTRIGSQNTAGGRVRNTITFPFKKN